MKRRFIWLWRLAYPGAGTAWIGTCPRWASQPLPAGTSLTRTRVLAVGPLEDCHYPGCGLRHPRIRGSWAAQEG